MINGCIYNMSPAPVDAPAHLRRAAGFTLIEAVVTVAMVGLFLSALMVMNSNVLALLRTAKDNASASQTVQERVERMRIANWVQITDANYIASTLLGNASASTGSLGNPVETVSVTGYRSTGDVPGMRAKVVRQNNATQIVLSNAALKDERMVRVEVNLTWRGFPRNRLRERATTALIAKGGITK